MTLFGYHFSLVIELIHFAIIVAIVLVARTKFFRDILGWMWMGLFMLSMFPTTLWLLATLAIIFALIHQFIAAIIVVILLILTVLFRLTNGFGVQL